MIDLLLFVTGGVPAEALAMSGTVGEAPIAVEDILSVAVRFAEGWMASLTYGYLLPTREPSPFGDDAPEPAIYGQRGWVRWSGAAEEVRSFSDVPSRAASPWRVERFAPPPTGGYGHAAWLAMRNFVDAIEGVDEPMYAIGDAMTVLRVIEAAYESARSGALVRLERRDGGE